MFVWVWVLAQDSGLLDLFHLTLNEWMNPSIPLMMRQKNVYCTYALLNGLRNQPIHRRRTTISKSYQNSAFRILTCITHHPSYQEHPAFFRCWRHSKGIRDRLQHRETKVCSCIKTVTNRLDIWFSDVAVGILLMLIAFLENDLIAKNGSYLAKIICISCLLCLTRVLFVYFVYYWDKLDMTRHD
jgi:hypothetical protein